MDDGSMHLQPGRSVGFMTLGCSLHEILTTIKAEVKAFPRFQLYHDDVRPISSPIQLALPDNGLRLQFDGPDQRLRLIEVLDFAKARLIYKDIEVFRFGDSHGLTGPKFRHIYDKLLGPTYGGEYVPPRSEDPNARGTYNLSYPGIAFNFPVQHSAYSPKKDFISLLSSSATGPATSMAVFSGESWQKARGTLFTALPANPRSLSVGKGKEAPDEIDHIKVHGEGRVELVRRSSPSFWIILSETTPQDLIMELGAPDSIYRKNDHRLSIHKDRRTSDASDLSPGGLTPDDDSDHGSAVDSDTEDTWEDDEEAALEAQEREIAAAEHFYNYYHHGLDILISQPTDISPPSPRAERKELDIKEEGAISARPLNHLTVTKVVLHGNVPGSYQFNRHRRSRWTLEHVASETYREPLSSEMQFGDISGRLKEVFRPSYESEEQERLQQRGMALNRGWGDSPGSSVELLGGFEDSYGKKSRFANPGSVVMDTAAEVGNVELFGFPGMVFEVLKNGARSSERVLHGTHSNTSPNALLSAKDSSQGACETFTLHDGPPYANGPLHIGHALNKVLKDIICRFQVSQGKKVSYIPGWDCHGLPIEIKALQAQKKDASSQVDAVGVRKAARELATRTIEDQKQGFKEWAVMGDWDNAYKTMDRGFEINQLEVFKSMFEKGLIYRQFKPVYWSPSSRTALAEAELEYDEGHQSLAAFVRFPVQVGEKLRQGALRNIEGDINVVIWTTTPWTLPANKAIALHKDMEYCLVKDAKKDGELTLIAASRVSEYEKVLERKLEIHLGGLRGSELADQLWYENPFQKANGLQPVLHADFVTDTSGTGLVHMAPGHGMDDYQVCGAFGIPAFAPVDDAGAFTKDAFPEHPELLEGLLVSDTKKTGSNAVCEHLDKLNLLRAKQDFTHKYPIDWRTKQPVITRATEQWFANVESIKAASMSAIANVNFLPETGRSRLESFIQGRSQWCISRQRAWGVPIPALYKVTGDTLEATMDSETIDHIINLIKERGIDAWWTDAQDDEVWKPKHLEGTFVRGRDTMDVWFDSGSSWKLLPHKQDQPVADVYLEGTDQHRGWFQSSLLTHVATQPYEFQTVRAPFKTLITHGFTLDSVGRKMSKSLGNVISPSQIMSGELLPPIKRKKQKGKGAKPDQNGTAAPAYDAMGPDALRLWVASSDYTRDVTIGQPVLMSVNQALHKYRVTFKWLLGIFSLPTCPPTFTSFNEVSATSASQRGHQYTDLADQLAIHRLTQVSAEVHAHFSRYEFFKGVNTLNKYIATDLSAFYFETLKDRIYTGDRQDCETLQRVLGLVFYQLLQMLAPVCPLLVEEVWDHLPGALRDGSIHPARALWQPLSPLPAAQAQRLQHLGDEVIVPLGSGIKVAQERLRADKKIGSSLEAGVTLFVHPAAAHDFEAASASVVDGLDDVQTQFASLFVVSEFKVRVLPGTSSSETKFEMQDPEALKQDAAWWAEEKLELDGPLKNAVVIVHPPSQDKCPRCWRFVRNENEDLCERCDSVVTQEASKGLVM
ncbi:isoleucine-tRNA ligase [Coniothyrium glycines]